MPSEKTAVIEYLFMKHWDATSQRLTKCFMSLDDVIAGIQATGAKLSTRNVANFLKDILRNGTASDNWPSVVSALHYTGVQRTGGGDCFEFIPFLPGQLEPFPDDFAPRANADRYMIQSISLPLVTKSLGRSDETWQIQTAINLRVVETHFAVAGAFKLIELSPLQMGIKLRSTEIDALFLGKTGSADNPIPVLVTCEAKQAILREDVTVSGPWDARRDLPHRWFGLGEPDRERDQHIIYVEPSLRLADEQLAFDDDHVSVDMGGQLRLLGVQVGLHFA